MATLLNIRQDYRNVDTCRTEMLDAWMRDEKPTWSKIVAALKEMKLKALAKRLDSKFCELLNLWATDYLYVQCVKTKLL